MSNEWDDLRASFENAKADNTSGGKKKLDRIPEAKYKVTITDAVYTSEDRKITFKLLFPQFGSGITRYKTSKLTPNSIKFVLSDLKRAGQEVEKLEDLPQAVANLRGAIVEVTVKNQKGSDEYQNFYFDSFVGRDRTVSEFHEVFGKAETTSDIPF